MSDNLYITKDLLQDLIIAQRQDVRKKLCSAKEAMYILNINATKLMELNRDPKTKIKKSTLKGKYLLDSIYAEVERLTEK